VGVDLALYVATAAYAAASALYLANLAARDASALLADRAHRALGVAVLAHVVYIVMASIVAHVCPVLSLHFFVSLAALVASALYLVVGRRAGIDALFLLATVAAVLYLVEQRRLKEKRPAGIFGRLPPLDALDRAEHWFLLTGLALLTVGIISGVIRAHSLPETKLSDIVRAALAWGTWLVFGGVVAARSLFGWRGRRAAWGTIAGFAFAIAVVIAYVVKRSGGLGP
jgi:ABC-type transport system involved in cytochrome c biogenesis permease subunit